MFFHYRADRLVRVILCHHYLNKFQLQQVSSIILSTSCKISGDLQISKSGVCWRRHRFNEETLMSKGQGNMMCSCCHSCSLWRVSYCYDTQHSKDSFFPTWFTQWWSFKGIDKWCFFEMTPHRTLESIAKRMYTKFLISWHISLKSIFRHALWDTDFG